MIHARDLHACSWGSILIDGEYVSATGYRLPFQGPIPSYEIAQAHNERVGERNWEKHISWWREYLSVRLLADGTVVMGEYEDMQQIEDQATIDCVRQMAREDRETLRARAEHARQVAESLYNGDPQAEMAIRCAVEYCPAVSEPTVKDGIDFWAVGRNASHDFYMGLRKNDDGTISYFSGSDAYEEPFRYAPVRDFRGGYYGHH